jgi:probable HAF family extracellular repeat protein
MKRFVRFWLVLFVAATLVVAHPTAASPQLIDLGTLGGDYTSAWDINNRGQVVGSSSLTGGLIPGSSSVDYTTVRAFLWENGDMINLGTGGGVSSYARAISDSGKIVGAVIDSLEPRQQRIFLWENGVMTILEGLGGDISFAEDINNRGQIAGSSTDSEGRSHAAFWQNGQFISLETPGEVYSRAFSVSESGQVLVIWQDGLGFHTFVWKDGKRTDLGTLGGCCTYAQNQSDSGLVAGWSRTDSDEGHAFLWKNGKMTDLGKPPGRSVANVTGVNNAGQILVNGWAPGLPGQAFVWERGAYRPLETPQGAHSSAQGINEKGQVHGYVTDNIGFSLAAVWDSKGKLTVLGKLGGRSSGTIDINSRGQVLGWSETDSVSIRSFIWDGK